MRSAVAALLIVLMGWAVAIDPLACPDGCADARGDMVIASAHPAVDADCAQPGAAACPFCLGVTAAHHRDSLTPGQLVRRVYLTPTGRPAPPPAHAIDHPPRLA